MGRAAVGGVSEKKALSGLGNRATGRRGPWTRVQGRRADGAGEEAGHAGCTLNTAELGPQSHLQWPDRWVSGHRAAGGGEPQESQAVRVWWLRWAAVLEGTRVTVNAEEKKTHRASSGERGASVFSLVARVFMDCLIS